MDLFDDDILKEKKKTNRLKIIIIVLIVILLLAAIGIFAAITYLQSKELRVYVDGVGKAFSADTFISDEGVVYIAAKDVAKTLGYTYYNGEYGVVSEDTTKFHVRNEFEAASFEANSKTIYKTSTQQQDDTEYFYIEYPTKFMNGKIYISQEAFEIGFNATFSYNTERNTITIYSLDYLTTFYTAKMANYGYKEIVDNFNNKKAMISGMIVVKREDGKTGVITLDGKEIIGAKYDDITYVETTKEFFVKNNSKFGLVNNSGRTKISSSYDKIELIDKDLKLYLVQSGSKYGVVDDNENKIIYLEYDKIGIDRTLYKNTNISNQYLLFGNCIPVQRDKKWGIYNKKGELILPIEYDSIGCVVSTSQSGSTNNAVIIPDYEAIIIGKDKKYGMVNSLGMIFINVLLDSVYSVTESGKQIFEFEHEGQRYRVDKYFEERGIRKVTKNVVDTNKQNDPNSISNTLSENETTNSTENQISNNTENQVNNSTANNVNNTNQQNAVNNNIVVE